MLKALQQVRSAFSLLNPDEVRGRAAQPVRIGLVASSYDMYDRMEDLLMPGGGSRSYLFRAGDPDAPERVDLVCYEPGLEVPATAYSLDPGDPHATLADIARRHDHLSLALARQFPGFRRIVVNRLIQTVARENAFFAVATALPDIIPSFLELPWAIGEWASDTAFLTANQVRMAFLIAAACGKEVGFTQQKLEILGIGAGAFGWRAIARELVGKIPLGGGLIPKGAIAYAGTFVVGKALERAHCGGQAPTREQRKAAFEHALDHGKSVVSSFLTTESGH